MSKAWEVTTEDVITALNVNGVDANSPQFFDEDEWDEFVDMCMSDIDHDAVEKAALRGDDMSEQSDLALETIEEQLAFAGRI